MSYVLLSKLDRSGGKLDLGSHYLHRYLRYILLWDVLLKYEARLDYFHLKKNNNIFPVLTIGAMHF